MIPFLPTQIPLSNRSLDPQQRTSHHINRLAKKKCHPLQFSRWPEGTSAHSRGKESPKTFIRAVIARATPFSARSLFPRLADDESVSNGVDAGDTLRNFFGSQKLILTGHAPFKGYRTFTSPDRDIGSVDLLVLCKHRPYTLSQCAISRLAAQRRRSCLGRVCGTAGLRERAHRYANHEYQRYDPGCLLRVHSNLR